MHKTVKARLSRQRLGEGGHWRPNTKSASPCVAEAVGNIDLVLSVGGEKLKPEF